MHFLESAKLRKSFHPGEICTIILVIGYTEGMMLVEAARENLGIEQA